MASPPLPSAFALSTVLPSVAKSRQPSSPPQHRPRRADTTEDPRATPPEHFSQGKTIGGNGNCSPSRSQAQPRFAPQPDRPSP
ncbi:unnamed protein product [Boreogadus saida]